MSSMQGSHHADFSAERRATIDRYLRCEVAGRKSLGQGALETLAVSLFSCDSAGAFTKTALAAAMNDDSVVAAARAALEWAGL